MIFPDKQLAELLEQSLAQNTLAYVEAVNQLFPDHQAQSIPVAGGYAIYTGLPYINTVIGMGFDEPVTSTDIDRIESLFATHQITPQIEVCPFTDTGLLTLLNERGYHLAKFYTAYVRPLNQHLPNLNPDIRVEPVDNGNSDIWVQTIMDISPDDATTDTRLAQSAFHRENVVSFVAWIDGVPVGASALSLHRKCAVLHFTATRPAYRNRGVQQAMIHARLDYAKSIGCEIAFSTSVPGNNSMRNIIRAGFHVAYTRLIVQGHVS